MGIKIINQKCKNCKECVGLSFCPMDVYTLNSKTGKVEIDNSKCINCGLCVNSCPHEAIQFDDND